MNTDGTLTNPIGASPWPFKKGSEPFRENKILVIDGIAGKQGGTRYCSAYSNPAMMDTPHHNGANCLFVDGHVAWLTGTASALNDGMQSWFRFEIPSNP